MNRNAQKKEQAKADLLGIIVDKSTQWRGRMIKNIGDMLKNYLLADPDMWLCVRKAAQTGLDHMWADIEHEIERNLFNSLQQQANNDELKGPSAPEDRLLETFYSIRSFFLRHYLPHNRSIFGKLNDPVYVIIYIATLLPLHGLRVAVYSVLLLMLLFPGQPDEFQLINFISLAKGMQFLTSGVIAMAKGSMYYFWCYSMHKESLLVCMDTTGPSASGNFGQIVDYFGTIVLVWIAFFCLDYSRSYGNVHVSRGTQDADNTYVPFTDDDQQPFASRQGGRLANLLRYDVICLAFSLIVLFSLTVMSCDVFPDGVFNMHLLSDPQFRGMVYWCCVLYSLLSLPFAVFVIPGLQTILTHSDPTGYNVHGACVAFEIPMGACAFDEGAARDSAWMDRRSDHRITRLAQCAVKVVRTIEKGQEDRGAPGSMYQFGDFTRGLRAKFRERWTRNRQASPAFAEPHIRRRSTMDQNAQASSEERIPPMVLKALMENKTTLDVASVQITEAWERDGRTRFKISVEPHASLDPEGCLDSWTVTRTYGQFRSLFKELGLPRRKFNDAPFPPRQVFGKCDGDRLLMRKLALERWLQRVINEPRAHGEWTGALVKFFSEWDQSDGDQSEDADDASISGTSGFTDGSRPSGMSWTGHMHPFRRKSIIGAASGSHSGVAALPEDGGRLNVDCAQIVSASEDNGRTRFTIEVKQNRHYELEGVAKSWCVDRRFGEFRSLHLKMGISSNFADAPFPSRQVFGKCTGEKLLARRLALDNWLARAIKDPKAENVWASPLADFLAVDSLPAAEGVDVQDDAVTLDSDVAPSVDSEMSIDTYASDMSTLSTPLLHQSSKAALHGSHHGPADVSNDCKVAEREERDREARGTSSATSAAVLPRR